MFLSSAFGPEGDKTLFHYTSTAGLEGILRTGSIWATNILYLNDRAEFHHAVNLVRERIRDYSEGSYTKLFFEFLFGSFGSLNGWGTDIAAQGSYVVSFSENVDQLSQWRAYARYGGYCIGIAPSLLKKQALEQGYRLEKCIYDEAEQKILISKLVDEFEQESIKLQDKLPIEDLRCFYKTLGGAPAFMTDLRTKFYAQVIALAPLLKDDSFSEEAEWRLVSDHAQAIEKDSIKFRADKHTLVPYLEFQLRRTNSDQLSLRTIVAGPSVHKNLNMTSSTFLCFKHDVVVEGGWVTSSSPYREWKD